MGQPFPLSSFGRFLAATRWVGVVLWCHVMLWALLCLWYPALMGQGVLQALRGSPLWWPERWLLGAGGAEGLLGIYGEQPTIVALTYVVTLFVAVWFGLTWRAVGVPLRRKALLVSHGLALTAVTVGAIYFVPAWHTTRMPASRPAPISSSTTQLQTIRSQLELYQVQHNGQYPSRDMLWDAMVLRTDEHGNTGKDMMFGPYLQQPPINLLTGGSKVGQDGEVLFPAERCDWTYDSRTGELRFVVPFAYWGRLAELGIDNSDVALGQWYEAMPDLSVNTMQVFGDTLLVLLEHRTAAGNSWGFWLILGCMAVGHVCVARRLMGRGEVLAMHVWLAMGLGLLSSLTLLLAPWSPTIRVLFGVTVLWSITALVATQWQLRTHVRTLTGKHCLICGYDLRGSPDRPDATCPECGSPISPSQTARL